MTLPPASSLRAAWSIDPAVAYLNHGTVGATPIRVQRRQQALRDEMERQPSAFLLREVASFAGVRRGPTRMRAAAADVAAFVGARAEDLGFTVNVTSAVDAVLRAVPFDAGDEIVLFDHAYGAVINSARRRARERGARVVVARMPFPVARPADVVAALEEATTDRARLVIVDHVTSSSALRLPVADLVRAARARGALVLVDGAHAPGAVPLDVAAIDADYYAANLHKWAWAPRSCGFLWARADRHAGLHAPIASWGLDEGLAAELDWQGTLDPTAALAAPEGVTMLRELGLDDVQRRAHDVAWAAAVALRDRVGATIPAPEDMVGAMATVVLPPSYGAHDDDARRLRDALLFGHGVEVQVHAWEGRVHVRVSGQVYVDDEDVARLVRGLLTGV